MKVKFLIIAVLSITLFSAGFVNAQSKDNLALIAELKAEIADLSAQLDKLQAQQPVLFATPATGTATWCYTFTKNLSNGSRGEEVTAVQEALSKEKLFFITPTGYFGTLTKQALIKFQEKYTSDILAPNSIVKGSGYVGSFTITKLNKLYACIVSN